MIGKAATRSTRHADEHLTSYDVSPVGLAVVLDTDRNASVPQIVVLAEVNT
jgi:hypothetical protein